MFQVWGSPFKQFMRNASETERTLENQGFLQVQQNAEKGT